MRTHIIVHYVFKILFLNKKKIDVNITYKKVSKKLYFRLFKIGEFENKKKKFIFTFIKNKGMEILKGR
jgi:hypothetical protein